MYIWPEFHQEHGAKVVIIFNPPNERGIIFNIMGSILSNVERIIANEGITAGALERKIGASKGVLSRAIANGTDIQSKWLVLIVENYPQYNTEWLLTGNGPMLKPPTDHPSTLEKQPEAPDPEPFKRRSISVQTPTQEETRQQKAEPPSDVVLSLLDTIRQQAEEIGRLKERLRIAEEELERSAEAARSSAIASAG